MKLQKKLEILGKKYEYRWGGGKNMNFKFNLIYTPERTSSPNYVMYLAMRLVIPRQ